VEDKTILVIDSDAASCLFIAQTLEQQKFNVTQAKSGREGLIIAWRDRPNLIIVDPAITDLPGLELIQKLRQDTRTNAIPVIGLSSNPTPDFIAACLEGGFNACLAKSGQAISQLLDTIMRLTGRLPKIPSEGGVLMAFLSAKGGMGTTSLCANIAMCIAQDRPEARLVVVDLVLPIGSIAQVVGYEGDLNLVNVADMPVEETTIDFFRNSLPALDSWGFRLLAGSPDPEAALQLQVDRIEGIIEALKSAFDYVIIDFGRSLSRISLPLIQQTDLLALILGTDLSSVELTKTLWDYLHSMGIGSTNIYPILNRAVGLEGMTKSDAEGMIGLQIRNLFPYMGGNFALANNQHQPIAQKFPNDTATVVMKEAADEMAQLAERLCVV